MKSEIRLTLNADGTVSQTNKGRGEIRWTWGPTAPRELANKSDSHTFDISVPGEHFADPLTGRWKERPAGRSATAAEKPR